MEKAARRFLEIVSHLNKLFEGGIMKNSINDLGNWGTAQLKFLW
jgi:hypothetical protein